MLREKEEEDFSYELQEIQYLQFFSNDLNKFKLENQLKTLTYIVDKIQVGKDVLRIISSLKESQKLIVSGVLRFVKLILLVPATNAVKTYMWPFMTQEVL